MRCLLACGQGQGRERGEREGGGGGGEGTCRAAQDTPLQLTGLEWAGGGGAQETCGPPLSGEIQELCSNAGGAACSWFDGYQGEKLAGWGEASMGVGRGTWCAVAVLP